MLARRDTVNAQTLSDTELIRRLQMGSDEALDMLLRRHVDALYAYCRHLTENREDAEDICQETVARVITRVDSLQNGSSFRSWLFSIARNLSVDAFRSRRKLVPLPDEENIAVPLPADSPQDRIEVREEHQTVADALHKLAASHQRVLMLREVEGMSYADIAHELDTSQSAVETLLFRARRRLREEYAKCSLRVSGLAAVGMVRELLARIATPISTTPPVATKVVFAAAIVGGAVVSVPHAWPSYSVSPFHRSAMGHLEPRFHAVAQRGHGPSHTVAPNRAQVAMVTTPDSTLRARHWYRSTAVYHHRRVQQHLEGRGPTRSHALSHHPEKRSRVGSHPVATYLHPAHSVVTHGRYRVLPASVARPILHQGHSSAQSLPVHGTKPTVSSAPLQTGTNLVPAGDVAVTPPATVPSTVTTAQSPDSSPRPQSPSEPTTIAQGAVAAGSVASSGQSSGAGPDRHPRGTLTSNPSASPLPVTQASATANGQPPSSTVSDASSPAPGESQSPADGAALSSPTPLSAPDPSHPRRP